MEDFKIELFEQEYKINFPNFVHLSENECLLLINQISQRFDLEINNLIQSINLRQSYLENIDAIFGFNLIETLNSISIYPLPKIYINWYQFDNIDLLDTSDLNKYFYDIWFPSADDIDLFDESFNWIVSIRHDGIVSFLKKENQ
ncbi:MAG: hypothetical protein Q8R57_06055 [Bacteroidota bacterium]|nr:hypothetical protein [Bacteroidota bacterium]